MAGFQDIAGHEQIISHLKHAVYADRVSHAYIFCGPEHSGKHMLAEAFARMLQCEHACDAGSPEQAEACGECRSCNQALHRNHPDIIYVRSEKKTLPVEEIREKVNQDILIKPYHSKRKIYIIEEAEKMNAASQNALLKTLEEPPSYAVILLLTSNADSFLPTILSRCVMLSMKPVPDPVIREYLISHCEIPDYQADLCVAFARGNVGQAMLLAGSGQFVEMKEAVLSLIRRVGDMQFYELFDEAKALLVYQDSLEELMDLLTFVFRDLLLCKATGESRDLIFRDNEYALRQFADRCSLYGLNQMVDAVRRASGRIRVNVNPELTLEMLLLDIKENIGHD